MKEMGAPHGFDPIPPDQYSWPLKVECSRICLMLWSWICAGTIARGRRSPFAVDARGRERHIEDFAREHNIDISNARRAWREGVQLGLWCNGEGKESRRMYLCGKVVPRLVEEEEEEEQKGGEQKGGEQKGKKVCTNLFPAYILKQIKRLPKNTRSELLREFEQQRALRDRVATELTAGVRVIFDNKDDTLLRRYGIKKIREKIEGNKKKAKKQDPEAREKRAAQLVLPFVERFVQTFDGKVSTNLKTESVQTFPPFIYLERVDIERTAAAAAAAQPQPPTPPTEHDEAQVRTELQKYGKASLATARRLLVRCRDGFPAATVVEVLDMIRLVAQRMKHVDQPIAFLVKVVPEEFSGYQRGEKSVDTCAHCGMTRMRDGHCVGCGYTRERAAAISNQQKARTAGGQP